MASLTTQQYYDKQKQDEEEAYKKSIASTTANYDTSIGRTKADTLDAINTANVQAKIAAMGQNEVLASKGLAGNLYAQPQTGYSETSRSNLENTRLLNQTALQKTGTDKVADYELQKRSALDTLSNNYNSNVGSLDREYLTYLANQQSAAQSAAQTATANRLAQEAEDKNFALSLFNEAQSTGNTSLITPWVTSILSKYGITQAAVAPATAPASSKVVPSRGAVMKEGKLSGTTPLPDTKTTPQNTNTGVSNKKVFNSMPAATKDNQVYSVQMPLLQSNPLSSAKFYSPYTGLIYKGQWSKVDLNHKLTNSTPSERIKLVNDFLLMALEKQNGASGYDALSLTPDEVDALASQYGI